MPPYALHANKTQSGIKTRSTLGGTPDNFNEIRFEDKKGSEELYIHAEKDQNISVEHNRGDTVGNDLNFSIGNNETGSVGNNRSHSIAKNETLSVGENRSASV